MIFIPSDISSNLPSTAVQEGIISASLNSSMVQNVLAGVYGIIYGSTVYFHITRKKADMKIVVYATSIMYGLSTINFIIGWWWLDQWMVNNGATRESMFLATIAGPPTSVFVFNYFVYYSTFVIANAFTVWRCYKLWDMNLRVIAVPSVGCLIQCCILLSSVVLAQLARAANSQKTSLTHQYNNVNSAFLVLSLVTTTIPTVLIAYKIHISPAHPTRPKLQYISDIILESGVLNTILFLFLAILSLIPTSYRLGTTELVASYYAQAIASVFVGMNPTLIMTSLSLKEATVSPKKAAAPTPSHVVSELRFGSAGAVGRTNRSSLSIQVISSAQDSVHSQIVGAGRSEKTVLFGIPETEKV